MSTFALGFNSICEMDYLPKDPAILVSSVNMLLRDEEFDTLEALCFAFSRDPKEIKDYLYRKGFVWSEQQKQFRPIGYDQFCTRSGTSISILPSTGRRMT